MAASLLCLQTRDSWRSLAHPGPTPSLRSGQGFTHCLHHPFVGSTAKEQGDTESEGHPLITSATQLLIAESQFTPSRLLHPNLPASHWPEQQPSLPPPPLRSLASFPRTQTQVSVLSWEARSVAELLCLNLQAPVLLGPSVCNEHVIIL